MKYLALLFLVSCGIYDVPNISKVIGPKFKVGDCAVSSRNLRNQPEFLEKDLQIDKIVKVGKRNYLYQWGSVLKLQLEFPITKYDSIMERIDCPKGF